MEFITDEATVICTSLANQKITSEKDAKPICDAIRSLKKIKTLNLEGISLGVNGAKAISKAIASAPTLQYLLWGDCFKGRLLEEIPKALEYLADGLRNGGAKIKTLDLSDNAFGPNGAHGVRAILCTPAVHSLEKLLLNNCGLGVGGGQIIGQGLESMNENIRKAGLLPKLRVFIAGRNRQEAGGSKALAKSFMQLGSLEEITMHQNGIEWKGATALSNCFKKCSMKLINLNDNILTARGALAIAEAVEVSPKLETLDLGDCLIRSEGVLKLATSMKKCPLIREINFSFGEVKLAAAMDLVRSLPLKQLKKLDLNGNKFGDEGCEQLREIAGGLIGDLDDDDGDNTDSENEHAITDSENEDDAYQKVVHQDESLVDQLSKTGCMKNEPDKGVNDQVEELLNPTSTVDFNNHGLKVNNAADAKVIVKAIKSIGRLVTLRLTGNTISPAGAQAISAALQNRPELQHLLFADIFTSRLKDEIPKAIAFFNKAVNKSNCRIRTLDLSDNAFGPNGAVAIEPWINSPACLKLQVLKLNNNGLGVHGGKMIANGLLNLYQLAETKKTKLNLKHFVCGRNRQEVGGTEALSEAFSKIKTLESIEMPQNGILVEGINALAKCIEVNPGLKKLNINDNIVTERGALAVGKAVEKCANLEHLDMGDCLIRNKGAHYLSEYLLSLQSLRRLNLSHNEIRIDGVLSISKVILKLPVFEKLCVNGNQLGDVGCGLLQRQLIEAGCGHKLGALDEDNEPDEDNDEHEEIEEVDSCSATFDMFINDIGFKMYKELGSGRDNVILSNCDDSAGIAKIAIGLIQDYPIIRSNAHYVQDIQEIFHKLLAKLYSKFSVTEGTTQLLTEVGLLKAELKERRRRLTKDPKKLQNLYFFLLEEVQKAYFPAMAKKYLLAFFGSKEMFALVKRSDCAHRNELVSLLYKF